MKQLIVSDKVQKELLTDFMIMGETRGLIGGYCENEFPVYYANEEMARMLGYDAVEEMVEAIDGKVIHTIHPDDREQVIKDIGGEYYEGLTYETTYRMPRKDDPGSGRLIKEKSYGQRRGNWLLSVPAKI